MRTLIVSATEHEIAPLLSWLGTAVPDRHTRLKRYEAGTQEIDVLVTGVGMVPTAAWCSRALMSERYDRAFNFGVCGTFDPALPPGVVVHVTTDCFAELGAEDGEDFLTIQQMGLLAADESPFRAGILTNDAPPSNTTLMALPTARGITVNTVHGRETTIADVVRRFQPQVESMEGAAFMYACLIHSVPFAQLRSVSNVVERRNRAAWKLEDAIHNLGEAAVGVVTRG